VVISQLYTARHTAAVTRSREREFVSRVLVSGEGEAKEALEPVVFLAAFPLVRFRSYPEARAKLLADVS
jgi:hypothetical protein